MQVAFAPDEVIAIVQPQSVRGASQETIRGFAGLTAAQPGDLSFLANAKYRCEVAATQASVVLLPPSYEGEPRPNQLFLIVAHPSIALSRLCARLERALWPQPAPGVHPSAVVAPGAEIAPSATIGPLCVVETGAKVGARSHLQGQVWLGRSAAVGEDCWLMPGARVTAECVLHNRVRLQPGAIVGADGFGYDFEGGRHEKIPQVGNVILEDDVEIGAGTTIDRARFSTTTIGEGSKIDNLVQIGHNVVIGKHCIVIAQTGISGSTVLEDYVILGGQVGTVGHITLGKGARVGAKSGVNESLAPGAYVRGNPARPFVFEQRLTALRHRLPELFKRVSALETAVGGPESPAEG